MIHTFLTLDNMTQEELDNTEQTLCEIHEQHTRRRFAQIARILWMQERYLAAVATDEKPCGYAANQTYIDLDNSDEA